MCVSGGGGGRLGVIGGGGGGGGWEGKVSREERVRQLERGGLVERSGNGGWGVEGED